jgi:hypothetical protein
MYFLTPSLSGGVRLVSMGAPFSWYLLQLVTVEAVLPISA